MCFYPNECNGKRTANRSGSTNSEYNYSANMRGSDRNSNNHRTIRRRI